MKFKVGDKVRVIADEKRSCEICIITPRFGQIGIVMDNDAGFNLLGHRLPYKIKIIECRFPLYFAEQDLELVVPEENVTAKDADPKIRIFESGATRDSDTDKLDYEGFLSPIVLRRYAQYMHKHRKQSDGTMRASDNWQKGVPLTQYMKSKWRHFMDTWSIIRLGMSKEHGLPMPDDLDELEDSLCAELFNTSGMLHEILLLKKIDRTKSVPGGY